MRKSLLILFFALLAPVAAHAAHYADTYVIPVVGHVQGANGTMWMSDLAIRNFSNAPLTVELIVIESGSNTDDNVYPLMSNGVSGTITVPANNTVQLRDVMAGHRGMTNSIGALVVGANAPFALTSRAYSNRAPLGQTVLPARDFLDNSFGTADNAGFAYIPGIVSNAAARTNVGFVAGSGGSTAQMVVEVMVRNAAGGIAGTRSFVIPAGRFAHMQVPVRSIASGSFDIGSVDVRIAEGEGVVVPYASVIDNTTGEAAYIMGVTPPTGPAMPLWKPSLFRSLIERNYR
ncbi:MAG TPA: hypothetical protein VF432_04185 [Thermoanaerobaculia bacterium]